MTHKESPVKEILSRFGVEINDTYEDKLSSTSASHNFDSFKERLNNEDYTKELVLEYKEYYKVFEIFVEEWTEKSLRYERKEITKVFVDKKSAWDYFISKQYTNLGDDMSHIYWNDDVVELWFGDYYGNQEVYRLSKWKDFDDDIKLNEEMKSKDAYSNFVTKTRWDNNWKPKTKVPNCNIDDEHLPF